MKIRGTLKTLGGLVALAGAAAFLAGCPRVLPVTAPGQPSAGPGGREYSHIQVRQTRLGEGAEAFFLYEPANPTPASAPVIALLHGYGGINPRAYGAWISHVVRRGNIVVFPIYQTTLFDSPDYTDNAMVALQDAYAVLDGVEHVAADPVNFALVGHSLGGTIAANLASRAMAAGLPAPRALMLAHAGDADTVIRAVPSILDPDLSGIPADMLMLAVVGDDDALVDETDALRIFDAAPQVATKEIVLIPTDDRGLPPLISNHHNPLAFDAAFDSGQSLLLRSQPPVRAAAATVDAHDFFGYWKLLDGLTSFAFFGRNREFALGRAPEQRFMGRWGDGVPVRQAEVIWP